MGNSDSNEQQQLSTNIEEILNALWQKIRLAGDTIAVLRDDNRLLQTKLEETNRELLAAKTMLDELKQSPASPDFSLFSNNGKTFNKEEVERLKERIKELITVVDQHLTV